MSKYEIRQQTIYTGETKLVIVNTEIGMYAYFCGYDFMGSAEWKSDIMEAYYMDREEAEQIFKDLEAGEETAEPEQAKRINAGYEIIQSIKTGKNSEIVIGKATNPQQPSQYVCWDCSNGDNYNNGGYTMNYRQALAVMAERITNRYEYLPIDF